MEMRKQIKRVLCDVLDPLCLHLVVEYSWLPFTGQISTETLFPHDICWVTEAPRSVFACNDSLLIVALHTQQIVACKRDTGELVHVFPGKDPEASSWHTTSDACKISILGEGSTFVIACVVNDEIQIINPWVENDVVELTPPSKKWRSPSLIKHPTIPMSILCWEHLGKIIYSVDVRLGTREIWTTLPDFFLTGAAKYYDGHLYFLGTRKSSESILCLDLKKNIISVKKFKDWLHIISSTNLVPRDGPFFFYGISETNWTGKIRCFDFEGRVLTEMEPPNLINDVYTPTFLCGDLLHVKVKNERIRKELPGKRTTLWDDKADSHFVFF
jgi:hypothetical protein